MESRLTIAVIYHNEERRLRDLLHSFDSQDPGIKENVEFLFVDNHSSDASAQIIDSWIKNSPEYSAQNLRRKGNHMAEARQQALEASHSPWVVFVDADSIVEDQWLKHLELSLNDFGADHVAIGGRVDPVIQYSWHNYLKPLLNSFPLEGPINQKMQVRHLPTNNCAYRREACLQAGGFDPFFSRVGEDLDLSVRLYNMGSIFYDPTFKVQHHLPEREAQWFKKMAYYGRAQSFVFIKNRGGLPWEKFLPGALVLLILMVLWQQPLNAFFVVPFLMIPRVRVLALTFLFYGLGQWVGSVIFFLHKLDTGVRLPYYDKTKGTSK